MPRIYSVLLASVVLLLGCRTVKFGDTSSPYYRPSKGSIVILHSDLEFQPQTARVFLQRGKTYGYGGIDRYYPWCYFQLYTVKDSIQTLNADTFEVYKVASRTEWVVEHGTMHLAGVRIQFGTDNFTAMSGDGGPSTETAVVQMRLRSEKQPQIFQLACGGAEENPVLSKPPSIDEIRAALGKIATLRLPE